LLALGASYWVINERLFMLAWYRSRWQRTKVGTVLATTHFCLISLLIGAIAISPSKDWPWWPIVPFVLDYPFSYVITFVSASATKIMLFLPHAGLERWLLNQREPFSSLDLFWLPAILFVVLGTLWHYYWPQVPRYIRRSSEH